LTDINYINSISFSILARASFAQERIIVDERIHYTLKDHQTLYAIPSIYGISSLDKPVSITRIRRALRAVVAKHSILRTALYLDVDGRLVQHRMNIDETFDEQEHFGFTVLEVSDDTTIETKLEEICYNYETFNLAKGRVTDFHILRDQYCYHSSSQNDDLLTDDDLIIFNFHHSVFDGSSLSIFFRDFCVAYETDCSLPVDDNAFQYIDYSVHERSMDMTLSREFWCSQLAGYNFDQPVALPIDRIPSLDLEDAPGASTAEMIFDQNVSIAFRNYASLHQVTPYQLAIATFYAFLFKIANGQSDICFTSLDANRHRSELQDMIGMFVATLPFRIKLDPCWSFDELVKHVQEQCLSIREHTHYPLQHMLADFHVSKSKVGFLETYFEFAVAQSTGNEFTLCGTSFENKADELLSNDSMYDFELIFKCDPTSDTGKLSCSISGAYDTFDQITIDIMTRRFEHLYLQLFTANLNGTATNKYLVPLQVLSLILPEEIEEMQEIVFSRLSNISNKGKFISLHRYVFKYHQY
jgi:hypothetical protein